MAKRYYIFEGPKEKQTLMRILDGYKITGNKTQAKSNMKASL